MSLAGMIVVANITQSKVVHQYGRPEMVWRHVKTIYIPECSLQIKNSKKPVVCQPSQAQIHTSKKATATPSTAAPSFQPPQSEMEMPAELTTPKSSAIKATSSQPSQEKMQTSNEMCKFNHITIAAIYF